MERRSKILFWFREQLSLEGSESLRIALRDHSEIIPVYCFDSREQNIIQAGHDSNSFLKQQTEAVRLLRHELQKRGSNLLVVHHHFEKIVPSLARVLNVNMVITSEPVDKEKSAFPAITEFRNQKAAEVYSLLDQHSIPVIFERSGPVREDVLSTSFPEFPKINPGQIPSFFPVSSFL